MLTKPNLDKNVIQSMIEKNYRLQIISLTFLPGGEASWGYKVDTQNNQTYFLKIHTGLSESEKRFDLTYRLYNDCGIKNITHPIKNKKGQLVINVKKFPAALFNFITGANAFEKPLNDKQRLAFGELLGKIHKAKDVIGVFSIKEDFVYGNTQRLLSTLDKSSSFRDDKSEYKRKTTDLLLENKDKILKRLEELKSLGDELKTQQLDFVICHGEPHRWNTMVNEQGEVFLIDWDDSIFAPKEKDLNTVKNDPVILEGYQHVIGEFKLNKEVIHYYNMEWNISEIDAWSTSLLYEESNDIQNQHYLEEFERDLEELNTKY